MLWVLFWKKFFYSEGGEALQQVTQRGGCPFPGNIPGQAGWGFGWPDLLFLHIARGWTRVAFKGPFPPKPFCNSMKQNNDKCLIHTILCLFLWCTTPEIWLPRVLSKAFGLTGNQTLTSALQLVLIHKVYNLTFSSKFSKRTGVKHTQKKSSEHKNQEQEAEPWPEGNIPWVKPNFFSPVCSRNTSAMHTQAKWKVFSATWMFK